MALTDAFPGVSGVVDTVELRRNLAGLIVRDTTGLPRAGVFPRVAATALVTGTATMSVDVGPFEAALVRGGGPLLIANDGTVNVPVGAAPASNSRYDIVYVKQNESAAPFADATALPVFGFVSGAPGASPSLPAALALVPVGGLPLGAVLIPSTATTTQSAGVVITPQYPFTAASGGVVVVRDTTELTGWVPVRGSVAYQTDLDVWWGRAAAGWVPVGGVQPTLSVPWSAAQAVVANTPLTVSNYGSVTVTHPGVFTVAGGVVTVNTAGWYQLSVAGASDGVSESKFVFVTKNGVTSQVLHHAAVSGTFRFDLSKPVKLAAGDTLRVRFLRGSNDFVGPNPDDATLPALQLVYLHP